VEVSARTGFGIANLRSEILNKIERVQPRKDSRPFRLNIDRSFSLKGHGTVVTGTVLSSSIKTGEAVQILPQGIISKIRAIQVHKNDTERALAGQRAAINLANVTPKESARGSVIVRPHTLLPTDSLLAEINTVNSLPFAIKKHAKVHIHLGTFETIGKISWYGEEKVLENGKSYIVYIKLNAFAAPAVDDPILLRSFSPVITIAGGKVLQINPPKLKKDSDSIETYYNTLKSGTISERITAMVEREGFRLFTINDFVKMLFLNETVIRKAAEKLVKGKKIIAQEVNNGTVFLSAEKLHTMMRIIESKMKEKVENYSFRAGFNVNEILELVKKYRIDEKYLDIALKLGINKGIFSVKNNLYNLKEAMKAQEQNIHFEKVEALYLSEGFTPPDFKSAAEKLSLKEKDVKDICTELHKRGILVSVLGKFYLHNEKYNTLLAYLKDYFGKNNTIKISAVRDFTQSSRKFVIPLMEYLDQKNITERSGEDRIKGANL
jgi:selenocysteine-specific elongation factor